VRNEAETRAELIDPLLQECGWGVVPGSKILREYRITEGRIEATGIRAKADIADYILVYKNKKLAVIEAKKESLSESEGVHQAKNYAHKLQIEYTYATNGSAIYEIAMLTGIEQHIAKYPSPEELWNRINKKTNDWQEKFQNIPFETVNGKKVRYYQELAANNTLNSIAENKERILLTLATGAGKTFIAFQIVWKLFHTRWNLNRDGKRRPRVLFLADRNILADQAFNDFSAFPEDALVRINSKEISKEGKVPMNGSIFFTIFQTFMSGDGKTPYYGDYPTDFFDFIIIDECHRGGANDESNWRGILEYFSPAVQLGLTATPKRKDNIDTYKYFGEPVYIYSLKQGVNDGFLTPFKIKRIKTTLDDYIYTPDDEIIDGEVEDGKIYEEKDFNRIIEIKQREAFRVKVALDNLNQNEKSLVFCATQEHAAAIRDLINQYKTNTNPLYCVRVTSNDGALGNQYLKDFQDNEKTIPTMLTTSQKLSTGVDARNIRNIVLLRPIKSMIEFKQIIGRGTRLYDGKNYFTIIDFVDAYKHFSDPEWDGEPIDNTIEDEGESNKPIPEQPTEEPDLVDEEEEENTKKKKLKIKLRDGKEREIQHMVSTMFWSADGKPISAEQFLENLFGTLPELFKNEDELREIWSSPLTRSKFLEKLSDIGYSRDKLEALQKLVQAEDSDLFDVLAYVAFARQLISREERVSKTKQSITNNLTDQQKEFIEFVLEQYIEKGVDELNEEKIPDLIKLKYHAVTNAEEALGSVSKIRNTFFEFQKILYHYHQPKVA
jgi:type I restriction enzyme R subunit